MLAQEAAPRVIVVGGGFAGACVARALKRADPAVSVHLVEANRTFTACPFSNSVIAGMRELATQQFGYDKLAADGVMLDFASATAVDAQARAVNLATGTRLNYDRLVLAPGIDIRWGALHGYTEAAAEDMRTPGRPESKRSFCVASSRRWTTAVPWLFRRRPTRSAVLRDPTNGRV
jgi:sulfide dehydrogenase [flavocytochrome c] flavoprotein chain